MNDGRLEPIRGGSLAGMAAQAVRAAIYSGRFKPGDALRELQLARDLRVSQTTVREALLQLEHAGLVVREANRGTRVTSLSDREVRERVALRIVLETTAAVEAAPRLTGEEFAELESLKAKMAACARRRQYYEAAQADLAFHRVVWQACGNQMLFRMLDDLTAPLFAFVSVQQSQDAENLQTLGSRHDPIIRALAAGRAAAIRAAIREHLAQPYQLAAATEGETEGGANERIRKIR